MSDKLTIAIVGGSPAGLTAAVILQRHGFNVTVFEDEPRILRRVRAANLICMLTAARRRCAERACSSSSSTSPGMRIRKAGC